MWHLTSRFWVWEYSHVVKKKTASFTYFKQFLCVNQSKLHKPHFNKFYFHGKLSEPLKLPKCSQYTDEHGRRSSPGTRQPPPFCMVNTTDVSVVLLRQGLSSQPALLPAQAFISCLSARKLVFTEANSRWRTVTHRSPGRGAQRRPLPLCNKE